MTLTDRDKRALIILGIAVVLFAVFSLVKQRSAASDVVGGVDPNDPQAVEIALKRLEVARRQAATTPKRTEVLNNLNAELKKREKGLIEGDTAAQAVAQLLTVARRVARNQPTPMSLVPAETGSVQALGEQYGQAFLSVQTTCQIEQLVNFLAELTTQPELITTNNLQVNAAQGNKKLLSVRIGLTAVVPRRLVPKNEARAGI